MNVKAKTEIEKLESTIAQQTEKIEQLLEQVSAYQEQSEENEEPSV